MARSIFQSLAIQFACAILVAISGGCSQTLRCGDAVYTKSFEIYGPPDYHQLTLEFPASPLSVAGSHRYKVRNLPATPLKYQALVEGPGQMTDVLKTPFANTMVTFSFETPSGEILAAERLDLGRALYGSAFQGQTVVFSHDLSPLAVLDGRSDWDVVIVVTNPSSRRGDVLTFSGRATTRQLPMHATSQ